MEKQGGELFIESELGKGTKLWFELSFEKSVSKSELSSPENGQFVLNDLKILIVEDTAFNQMLMIEILKKYIQNVETVIAENGKIALEKLNEHNFDLILMDIKMPVMDGFETTKAIRNANDEQLKKIPILAVTANAFPEQLEKCKAVGMNDSVAKPINEKLLLEKIFSLTQGSKIDLDKLKSFMTNDEKRVQQFLDIFKTQTPQQLKQLKVAIETEDFETISITAHAIKSQCRYLGLEISARTALQIEELAENGKDSEKIHSLIDTLKSDLNKVIETELN